MKEIKSDKLINVQQYLYYYKLLMNKDNNKRDENIIKLNIIKHNKLHPRNNFSLFYSMPF